jgi:hypothetical protein
MIFIAFEQAESTSNHPWNLFASFNPLWKSKLIARQWCLR